MIEDLPEFLTEYRKVNPITQEELANELGLSAGAVSADESGRYRTAGLDRLLQVVNALIRISHRKNIN
jgi:predicted transcriptional regulator